MDIEIEKEKNRLAQEKVKDKQMIETKIFQQTESNGEIAFIMPNSIKDDLYNQKDTSDLSMEMVRRIYDWNLILNNKKLIRKYYPLLLQNNDTNDKIEIEEEEYNDSNEQQKYAQMIKFSSDEILQGLQSVTMLVKQRLNDPVDRPNSSLNSSNVVLKSLQLIDNFDMQESTNSIKQDIRVTYISIGDPFNSNDDEYLKCLQQKKGQVQYIQIVPHSDFNQFTNQTQTKYTNSDSYKFIQHSMVNMPTNSYIFLIESKFEKTAIILFEMHIKKIIKDFKSKLCILTYDSKNIAKFDNITEKQFGIFLGQLIRKVSRIFQNQLIIIPQIYPNSDSISEEFQIKLFMNSFNACIPNRQDIFKSRINSQADNQIFDRVQILCNFQDQIKLQIPKTQLYILQTYQEIQEESKIQYEEEREDLKAQSFIYLLRKNPIQQMQNTNEDTFKLDFVDPIIIDDDSIIQIDYSNEKILVVIFQEDKTIIYLLKFTFNENKYHTLKAISTKYTKEDVFYLSDNKIYVFGYQEQKQYWKPTLSVYVDNNERQQQKQQESEPPTLYTLQEGYDKTDKYYLNGAKKNNYSVIKSNLLTRSEPNYQYFVVVGGTYERDQMMLSGQNYNSKLNPTKSNDVSKFGYQYNCTFEQIKINDQTKSFERIIIDKQKFFSPSGHPILIKESLNPYLIYSTPSSFYYIENYGNYNNFAKEPSIYLVQAIQPKIILTKYTMDQKYLFTFTKLYYYMNPQIRNYWLTNNNLRLDLCNIYNDNKRSRSCNPLLLGQRKVRVCSNFTFNFRIQSGNFSVEVEAKTQQYELNLPKNEIYRSLRYKNWLEQIKDTYIYNSETKNQYIVFYKSWNNCDNWTHKTFIFSLDTEFKSVYQDFDEVACHDVEQNAIFVARKYFPCHKGSFKLFYCLGSNFQDLKEQESDISLQIDLTLLNTQQQEYADYQQLLMGIHVDDKNLYVKFVEKLVVFNKHINKKDQKYNIEIKQIIDNNYEILRYMNVKEATQMVCNKNNLLIYYERALITYNNEQQTVQGVFNYVLIQPEQQNHQPSKQQIAFDLSLYQKEEITKIQLKINNIQLYDQDTFKVNILEFCEQAVQIRHQYLKLVGNQLELVKSSKNENKYETLGCFTPISTNRKESSFCINNQGYKRFDIREDQFQYQ